jgi:hypothetical protein
MTVPAVLEPTLVTGYPEEQLPTPDSSRGVHFSTPIEEKLHHGRAQAEDVALEHP